MTNSESLAIAVCMIVSYCKDMKLHLKEILGRSEKIYWCLNFSHICSLTWLKAALDICEIVCIKLVLKVKMELITNLRYTRTAAMTATVARTTKAATTMMAMTVVVRPPGSTSFSCFMSKPGSVLVSFSTTETNQKRLSQVRKWQDMEQEVNLIPC